MSHLHIKCLAKTESWCTLMQYIAERRCCLMRKSTCFCLVEYNLFFIMRPFLFQVIKALSRNSITATMLGKDVVATFANKIIPKMAAHAEKKSTFVAKLRVSLETLHYLTKPSKYWKWDSYVLLTCFLSIKNLSSKFYFWNMFRRFRKKYESM